MYIYKMIYAERADFRSEDFELLEDLHIIWNTDYGTVEISSDTIQDLFLNEIENRNVIDILNNNLGKEVVSMLNKGELDLVLICY